MPVSTQNLVEDSGYSIVNSSANITIGDYDTGGSVFWNDCTLHVSQNLCLEKRSNNFLIINGGKTFITWSDEECRWVEYKINSLEKKFKKNLKRKECKPFRDDSSGLNVMDMLICQEGNYYVDLKNSLYYVYSDGFWNSLDLIGDLFIDIERPTSLKNIKNKKNEKKLLTEKIPISFSLETGYVYTPYALARNLSCDGGTFCPSDSTISRYAINNINTDYYSSIDTTGV
jgi:hypothetical protein